MEILLFRNWIKAGGEGDWWVFVRQPATVLDRLFKMEAIAMAKRPSGAAAPE